MAAMDLKTYRSKTMAGALAEVKKDLGPDAVILRTRSFKAGGVLGFGGSSIVEITATRDAPDADVYKPARAPLADSVRREHAAAPREPDASSGRRVPPAPATPVGVEAREPEPSPEPTTRPGRRATVPATQVELQPVSPQAHAALEGELASIRRLVGEVLQTTRRTAVRFDGAEAMSLWASGEPEPLFDLYDRLTQRETPEDIAEQLVAGVRDELNPHERKDASIVRETALRHIAGRLRAATPLEHAGGPVVEALIGPTGVGKTTTIAKLAATHKLRYGRSVGLITADTYRIAAVEQLRTYAGIIGIPLEVALSPDDMEAARDRLAACDVVLIDTPGRSPRDHARLDDLSGFLAAASPARTHLVLSASTNRGVLRSAAERFAGAEPDCLLLSKLDEASGLGVVCRAAEIAGLPLSYVTTGQEVPDHIEPACPERLARLVLEGEVGS
jgi:flagellar biosynthesis protein FlhF